jgi:tRNA pseudouridine55 synthase
MTSKQAILNLYKRAGETPLACLKRFQSDNPEYGQDKMTYAGRLDPLASGVLLVLVGEECKNKEKYLGLDKEYKLEVLFGVATDTQDVLGLIKSVSRLSLDINRGLVENSLPKFIGKFIQDYPAYSSKTVKGKSLFFLAKAGKIDSVKDWPTKEVEIYKIELLGWQDEKTEDVSNLIQEKIKSVKGDFRQVEILANWDKYFRNNNLLNYSILKLKVTCSSGAYMRSLAEKIGQEFGMPALALNIVRTRLGKYRIKDSLNQ